MYENIIRFPRPEEKLPFRIQMCGTSFCDGTYKISRPHSTVCCIEYILSGSGTVEVDGNRFTAKAGDVYLLKPHANHLYYADAQNPWIKIWFNVEGELVDSLLACYRLENSPHIPNLPIYPLFRSFLDTAVAASEPRMAYHACAAVLLQILQAIHDHLHTVPMRLTSAQQLKDKIDALTDFTQSFDDLLSGIYCTKSHIIRSFKAAFGITPYHYLLKKKLLHAKLLLSNSAMHIGDVANALGFRDSHYFSNFFKKHVGLSPQQYRNRH